MKELIKKPQRKVSVLVLFGGVLSGTVFLASCAATQTAIEHHSLEASTQLSETVFLDPVAPSQKTIFLAVKNTSEESMDIARPLAQALTQHGYRVLSNPSSAHYMLQANILKIAKMSRSASQTALGGGYGSALAGAGAGVAVGALAGSSNSMLAGGIAGGLIGLAADSLVKDVNYTLITDVQISEKVGKGVAVHEQFNSALTNGSSSTIQQVSSKQSDYQRYRTRIVSNADRVNLSFEKARPMLELGLVKTLAGIF